MRKLGFLLIVMILFAGVSVNAQKKRRLPVIQPPTPQSIIIQDEKGEGFMFFDVGTGAYKCRVCEYDYSVSGIGGVKTDGCVIYFSAIEDGYAVNAFVNACEQTGTCFISVTKVNGSDFEPWEEELVDPNLRDSQAACLSPQPPPTVIPSEIILQNDADGSFLLFTTSGGEFKFIHCEDNTAMSGKGVVKQSGQWISFEAITTQYRILASVNLDTKEGKAVVDVLLPFGEMVPMQEIISDANFTDNVAACGTKK
jgi:hypothetical protein